MRGFPIVLLLSGLAAASGFGGEPDVAALLAQAKQADPVQRAEAYAKLREAGPGARSKLALFLEGQYRYALNDLRRLLAQPAVRKAADEERGKLEAARAKALALIRDENAYPENAALEARKAVEAAVSAVEVGAAGRREAVLAAVPELTAKAALAEEYLRELALLDRPPSAALGRFEAERLVEQAVEPAQAQERLVRGANLHAPSLARPIERLVLEQVNAYRAALGLAPLRFDGRLYRAAAWFARHSAEANLRGHFCDIAGRNGPTDRAEAEGHRRCNGEAVAYNGCHFEDWLRSPSHHRVLVDAQAGDGAVAVFRNVAVLATGLSDSSAQPGPPGAVPARRELWADLARAGRDARNLESVARFLQAGRGKGLAEEAWAAVLAADPGHAAAREALGYQNVEGRWRPRRTAQPAGGAAALEAIRNGLAGDAMARYAALLACAANGAAKLLPDVEPHLAAPDPDVRAAAWEAAAVLGAPALKPRALKLLASEDPADRAAACAALEVLGGDDAVEELLKALERNLSEYSVIRALEVLIGKRLRMNYDDDQPTRELKIRQARTGGR
ncbi:MAG: CAP domain-containing protein [Planctomycetota bacterium]|nr:CAP domain-containing protein [Planctomycetota bacterium]